MADVLRIKRRVSGAPGAPSGLANAELAYNEVDHILYYGEGTGGAGGTASVITAVGGIGLASSTLPIMNSATASAGSSTQWSRGNHIHPSDTSKADLASPTFTGIVTISGTITGAGMVAWAASPPAIGSTTPSTGAFSTLSASGTVSGAGFTSWAASPPPIGSTVANTGAFTNLTVSGSLSGSGLTGMFSAPGPIGSVTPSSGAFTTLSASGVVSGTGFNNLFASPPAIGGTTASAGTFTNLNVTGTLFGTGVATALTPYAKIDSQAFTGTPSLPTGATGITQANTLAASTLLATTAYVRQTRLDQLTTPTATVSMNAQILSNVLQGPNGTDVATRAYVDANSAGLVSHTAVAAATTANITLSTPQTIDGYAAVANDRILVKNQTTAAANGIYIVQAGAWTRAADMDNWLEVPQAYVFVSNGTVNAASSWVCNSLPGGTLDTTAIVWAQFSQQAQVIDGAGLVRTGNTFDVKGTLNRILVNADSIDIDPTNYAGQASITILGTIATGTWNATTITVNKGGTGVTTLTGYVKGTGTTPFTASATIPNTDIIGLGSMAIQNAGSVAIIGGTIDGITFDMGTF